MSVHDFDQSRNPADTVKHYRIRNMDNGGYYIAVKNTFEALSELIVHYRCKTTIILTNCQWLFLMDNKLCNNLITV